MVKIIAITSIAVGVLLLALLASAGATPDTLRVQHATSIQVPPERIFALICDFHCRIFWSACENLDPAFKGAYTGAASASTIRSRASGGAAVHSRSE